MGLAKYRQKRNFAVTSELHGDAGAKQVSRKRGHKFVIQKHAASHLHYDFRLEMDGVLKSWAVPKGPSLDPKIRRLAMLVEDHPLEYGSFEGTIPEGQYGAGTVMVWDSGTWEPENDPKSGLREGKLHFVLHGEKLSGRWVLVRPKPADGGRESWLLFKLRDDEARTDGDVLEDEPLSVKSGRDMEQIASGGGRVWQSGRKASSKRASEDALVRKAAVRRRAGVKKVKELLAELPGKQASLPTKIVPQLATLAKKPPEGDTWFSEIKYDGYRMICRVDRDDVTFTSRNQLDWTRRFPHLVKAVRGLGVAQAIFDGEVVAQQEDGTTSFQALQNAFSEGHNAQLVYYIFDLLYLNGVDLRKTPLEDRKQLLAELLGSGRGSILYSEHVVGRAGEFFEQVCKARLEGIICKRRDRPYFAGRSADWLKIKSLQREEFVIGAYTLPSGSRQGFGALAIGYYDKNGDLINVGKVGTGFSDSMLVELTRRLKEIEQDKSPFKNLKGRIGSARGMHWVQPQLVAQVQFSDWTSDGIVRHPSFQGLREDKNPTEVTREKPLSAAAVDDLESSAEKTKMSAQQKSAKSTARSKRAASTASGGGQALAEVPLPASVRLTSPDKVLYPDEGITKQQLAGYYAQIGDWILPHLVNCPLVLVRCPEGVTKKCFYQKHPRPGTPEQLRQVMITESEGPMPYVVVDNLPGLLSLAQLGALEIHVWGSRADKVEKPDRLVFDLDPAPDVTWKRVAETARQLRTFLADLGLTAFLKTSGGKGLHLVVPITPRIEWDEAKGFCLAVAEAVERADPERYISKMTKAARVGKIYIDYLRNARSATSIAAYSTRARPGAAVSTPITWEELADVKSGDHFNMFSVVERLAKLKRDPWQDIGSTRQSITKAMLKHLTA